MSIVQNDTSPFDFFMADASDPTGETGKAGLLPADITFKRKKSGGNFATGTGAIAATTGASVGWFTYTPVAGDVDTLGDLSVEASAAGCFTWRDKDRVVEAGTRAADWTSARAAKVDNLDNLDAAISTIPSAAENAAEVLAEAAAAPIAAELKVVNGTTLGVHAGTPLDPFGP